MDFIRGWNINFGAFDRMVNVWLRDRANTKREMSSIVEGVQSGVSDNHKCMGRNALMSLPTSLSHCILSYWVDIVSVIRLDFALIGDKVPRLKLLDILKSNSFYVRKVKPTESMPLPLWGGPPPSEHLYTKVVSWLIKRQVKVADFELHGHCSGVLWEEYLQRFAEHVRGVNAREDNNTPTQLFYIAKYCYNLASFGYCVNNPHDGNIRSILNNNSQLEKLDFNGGLSGENDLARYPISTLPHLRQLKWTVKYGFEDALVGSAKAAPNLQKLLIRFNPAKCQEIESEVVNVGHACPNLRTLSCNELHFGPNDRSLQPFLAACKDIVNLDLSMHYELTEDVLIEALGELHSLHCLNLRGCSRLTDRTLQFLVQRFAITLKVLYLDHFVYPPILYEDEEEDEEGNLAVRDEITGGYTAAGIASLRAQCTHLHTFHYSVQVNDEVPISPPLYAFQNATIVHIFSGYEEFLPMILENCQQMQILTMTCCAGYRGSRVWLSVDQLMAIAARCPQLHTVIIPREDSKKDKEVDYRAVKEAFPKLLFTEDNAVVDLDILEMPV